MPTSIIVHERIADWVGRLRPRFAADPTVRWVESRSTGDLVAAAAAAGPGRAIVVVNLAGGRTLWGLNGLEALDATALDPLVLVLDPDRVPEVPTLARELGATLVLSGVAVPPRVELILRRFLRAAEQPPAAGRPTPDQPTRPRPAPSR